MTTNFRRFTTLSDAQLLDELRALSEREWQATVQVIACLIEVDSRRLYLAESCSSLFTYCTRVLHLSEHAAYGRIEAARAARRFPSILDLLAEGAVTLTTVCLLAPHLTTENHESLLDAARHRSKRDVEQMVAALHPATSAPSTVRKLPTVSQRASATAARQALPAPREPAAASDTPPSELAGAPIKRPAVVVATAPERFQIKLTVSRETHDKLRRVQDLIRHAIPNADPAVIFDRALTLLLGDLEKARFAATERPRARRERASRSRHVPASVRREVWMRDGGQCAFVGRNGRCSERGFLEFHHLVPYADGGEMSPANLQLRCRAHNAYEMDQWFPTWPAQESCSVRTELSDERARAGSS